MRHKILKGLLVLACVGVGLVDNIWAYTPNGVFVEVSGKAASDLMALQALNDHSRDNRNGGYVGENWGRMPGESQADQQAKALGAMMLLGALCERVKKEQEQQAAEERQKETAKQENQPQPKASERRVAPTPVKKHKKSMGAGMWFVLVLLGCVGAYVMYGELKHRSEPRGKQLPRLNRPNIVCPHCGCAYEYDPELVGVVVQCSSCNKKFVVQKTA